MNCYKMKKTLFLSLLLALLASATVLAQPKKTIVFENLTHDFGTIEVSEEPYTAVFSFKNAGLLPLQVQVVSTPCVCTSASWTKEEIAPGESGEVTVTYKAEGPLERMSFVFYVYSNGIPNPIGVSIKGKVVKKKE